MLGTMLLGAGAIVTATALLIPSREVASRLAGYQVVTDVAASGYVVSTYAATGAAGGLTMAVVAAVGISLAIRLVGRVWGRQRYQYKGSTGLAAGFAALITQGAQWVRSFFGALFRGDPVSAPPPLNGGWVAV